jgi:hypothetical protein
VLRQVWSLIPLVEGEVFMVGALDHLKKAVGWARTVGLQVSRVASPKL